MKKSIRFKTFGCYLEVVAIRRVVTGRELCTAISELNVSQFVIINSNNDDDDDDVHF